jgi:hypothetical protein
MRTQEIIQKATDAAAAFRKLDQKQRDLLFSVCDKATEGRFFVPPRPTPQKDIRADSFNILV